MNKKGFYATLEILDQYDQYQRDSVSYPPMSLRAFFLALELEGSYYNAFTRVKNSLIKRNLIEIYRDKNTKKRFIFLTKKGRKLILQLKSIFQLLDGGEK